MTDEPLTAVDEAADAICDLYDGIDLHACDVPRRAWPRLLRVITVPQNPPRPAAVQTRMDALAASIAKESV